jgi:hypothetical protein
MDATATVMWMAPWPPDAQQARALSSWSSAHGVKLSPPAPGGVPRLVVDAGVGDGVETLLDTARDAIAAREREQAERALESAESLLRAHPELPQGAWLMAEVERAWSARFLRVPPVDLEAAARAWLRAGALDGGRVPGVGEEDLPGHPSQTNMTIELESGEGQMWLDGGVVGSQTTMRTRGAGIHSVVVTKGGAPVWAGWIDVPAGSSTVRPEALNAIPCSTDDLARAAWFEAGIDAHRVRCPSWVAALAGASPGSVAIAACGDGLCGLPIEWRAPVPWMQATKPSAERDRRGRWPAWATWTAAGAAAAIAATVLVVVLQPTSTETRFISGGLKTQ